MALVEQVYRETATFPPREMFGLTAQMRRAAVSIPSNLAEGSARNSSRELLQFVGISCGSLAELETQIELAIRLDYLDSHAECARLVQDVGKLLTNLRRAIKARAKL